MRILVLASEPPWPLCYGGRLHCYELCRRLALRHELLLAAQHPCEESTYAFNFECRVAQGGRLYPDTDTPPESTSFGRLDRFFGVDPSFVADVVRLVDEWQPDIVLGMNYPSLAWLARIERLPTICDLLDDPTLHCWRERRHGTFRERWLNLKSLAAVALFERRYLRLVSAVTVLSELDQRWCRCQARGTRVECIPHGVDCDYFTPLDVPEDENEIIFWGGLTFRPNISAVLHFADRVWPLVRQRRPETRWKIVGWGSPPQLERIRDLPGVSFAGRVDDLRPHVARAGVAVAPMISGAGIKNKVMEAWAMGKAVVCTPIALGSLPGGHLRNVWVARSPHEQADGILSLLSDAALRKRIGSAARATAETRCSWNRAAQQLEALFTQLTHHATDGARQRRAERVGAGALPQGCVCS
jgi:glycosyltransferase involved in cell wall biosynthesis